MSNWLKRVRNAVSGSWGNVTEVRRQLQMARQSRVEVRLDPPASAGGPAGTLIARIQDVQTDGFVITQPVTGGAVRFLKQFARFRVSFQTPRGVVAGETKVLGRVRISLEGGGHANGYRLALPDSLLAEETATDLKMLLGGNLAVEAELHIISRKGPVMGIVTDLNPAGAHLRCRNAVEDLHQGQKAQFRLDLPEPVGRIREWVSIAGAETDPDTGDFTVRVAFEKRNEAIAEAMHGSRVRRSA
ncbi:MAG: hypothetical protein JSV91_02925 [Phycisphaerales bacterium]|nr:MAG: hypothetical protein JSV91_02925 [Phycisphaerales bacterium]